MQTLFMAIITNYSPKYPYFCQLYAVYLIISLFFDKKRKAGYKTLLL